MGSLLSVSHPNLCFKSDLEKGKGDKENNSSRKLGLQDMPRSCSHYREELPDVKLGDAQRGPWQNGHGDVGQ